MPSTLDKPPKASRALGPFQFSVLRLIACTTFVALAAWVSTVDLPVSLSTSALAGRDMAPIILIVVLLAAAVGVLFKGKEGAKEGVQAGCAIAIAVFLIALPVFASLRELFVWLARIW